MTVDRTNEDGARATTMDDEWIVWKAEERVTPGTQFDHLFLSLFIFCMGTHTPRFAHSMTLRAENFIC